MTLLTQPGEEIPRAATDAELHLYWNIDASLNWSKFTPEQIQEIMRSVLVRMWDEMKVRKVMSDYLTTLNPDYKEVNFVEAMRRATGCIEEFKGGLIDGNPEYFEPLFGVTAEEPEPSGPEPSGNEEEQEPEAGSQ